MYRPNPNFVPSTPPLVAADFSQPILVVHFWAIWNGADPPMDEELSAVRPDYQGKICFRSCDTDKAENQQFCEGFANVPAITCYMAGSRFKTLIGFRKAAHLRKILYAWLSAEARMRGGHRKP